MAMNKAERAHVEALETRLAFAWPTEAEPRRTVLEGDGWDYNAYRADVSKAWTEAHRHGYYYQGKRMGASRERRPLYATFEEARLALRWAMCREYAAALAEVDKMGEPTP